MTPDGGRLLSVMEVALTLKMAPELVYGLIHSGTFAGVTTISGGFRVPETSVLAYLNEKDATESESSGFLTVREIARRRKVSRKTVYRLIHSGQLDFIRAGRDLRIPEASFKKYQADHPE